jgi:hypothetical protein
MKSVHKMRRTFAAIILLIISVIIIATHPDLQQATISPPETPASTPVTAQGAAVDVLNAMAIKGRAPKTDYSRSQFGDGWTTEAGCDTRNIILHRDLLDVTTDERCRVTSGTLTDPYTAKTVAFMRGESTSDDVQIDHVVALSNAWQTGAQALTHEQRIQLANDPLELLAVDGEANMQKSDGDAASWLPSNKAFRCQYVARQIAVKAKYQLWVTAPEKEAMIRVLSSCPGQILPTE